ncbi:spore coat protein [Bacillus pseudomycoides]|uniref:Spore coat protein n=1 Tax=Bacillus pseudomycoides TaxID=64104 RepID=A0A2H3MFS5_9BACI|nr:MULTISPECIES: CotY/CotZ family spore coat protein [Bacillus]AIK37401.1 spore coat Z family protein [Bacillus pseudomycoides]AJI18107.1 spore coat Z family protein [Bacillus pseudomycoides]EEM06405.1 Spore coat protein [Bacillus pseudomycoides]EEM17982.1 Spore coat protein [Bacillus pseudomycoides DSM 12442]KFN13169.1 spore coat Z family protein [Bacillus pseudomycoides]
MSCKDERHDHHHHRSNCVCDVVKFIDELQDCASSACPTGCDAPFLGANQGAKFANTRPFLLYTTEGELFSSVFFLENDPTTPNDDICARSPIFRVESVDDCCAVLRILVPPTLTRETSQTPEDIVCAFLKQTIPQLISTNLSITVDLNCFCAIQCLRDVNVPGV